MKRQRVIEWAETLTEHQLKTVCINVVAHMIDTECVRFPSGTDRPYWESCGESLDGVPVNWEDV